MENIKYIKPHIYRSTNVNMFSLPRFFDAVVVSNHFDYILQLVEYNKNDLRGFATNPIILGFTIGECSSIAPGYKIELILHCRCLSVWQLYLVYDTGEVWFQFSAVRSHMTITQYIYYIIIIMNKRRQLSKRAAAYYFVATRDAQYIMLYNIIICNIDIIQYTCTYCDRAFVHNI